MEMLRDSIDGRSGTKPARVLPWPASISPLSRMLQPALALATLLGVGLGYYVTAVIGTVLSVPPSGFAIIWPATAFVIGILLITPIKRWWLCIVAVVSTHFYLAAELQPTASFLVVLTQVTGNLTLALSTVVAVRAIIGKRIHFDTLSSVVTFIFVAGIAVPAVVNALILGVHVATGWTEDLWLSWRQWMLSCIFPTVTIPPLMVLASSGRLVGDQTSSSRSRAELAILAGFLFAVSFEAYGGIADVAHWPALLLVPIPFLVWAAVRFDVGGTSLSLLVIATAIVAQALRHQGPFALNSPADEVVSIQVFLIVTSIPLLVLAALMDERRRTATLLRQSQARMNVAASTTDTGLWQWEEASHLFWLTDHCTAMFGWGDAKNLTPYSFLDAVHPEDRPALERTMDHALKSAEPQRAQEYRVICNGKTRWLLLQTHSQFDRAGKVQVSGIFRDVTDRVVARLEADDLRQRLARLRDDERRRIAEELHDSTAQHLVAARLSLLTIKPKVRSVATRSLLAAGLKSLHDAMMEVRTFAYLLHPPQLGRSGLCGVLQQYVPGFENRTGVLTSLRISPIADLLAPEQQHAIFRITQESLSNVHRHAQAKRVSISVRCIGGLVHLVVSDDGKGISLIDGEDLSDRLCLGVGIPGMAARVQQLGGRFNLASNARGTTVHVAIPLAQSPEGSVN